MILKMPTKSRRLRDMEDAHQVPTVSVILNGDKVRPHENAHKAQPSMTVKMPTRSDCLHDFENAHQVRRSP